MVEINFDARRPEALLDLNRVSRAHHLAARRRPGAARGRGDLRPAHHRARRPAARPGDGGAHRRVAADPQPRHGRRQPRRRLAGRGLPPGPAGHRGDPSRSTSVRGPRQIPAAEFFTGPKRNALAPDELITAVLIPVAPGPQQFAKIGTRNAMVIAVCAFALELRPPAARAAPGSAPGSARPGRRRCGPPAAEEFLAGALAEAGLWESAAPLPDAGHPAVRRAGRGGGPADRRRARHRGLPPARAVRAGPADPDLGLAVRTEGKAEGPGCG